jgi:branched-subunit amino acid aminotransferase/4-amino-4-deoxychorismate lyase
MTSLLAPARRQEARLRWQEDSRAFGPAADPGQIIVIDSWLVSNGRSCRVDAHARRFGAACERCLSIPADRTSEFLRAAVARIPAVGRWFPRVELAVVGGVPRLQLWIRPAPPPGQSVRLWLLPGPDARTQPRVKGPDLAWLAAARNAAVAAGADEAVLLSADGKVLEGTTTSILWWRGDTLCAPPVDSVLPGTTRSILTEAVAASGAPVACESPRARDLSGLEVWAVNALHGIRPVTGWVNEGISAGPAHRAARWQRYLEEIAADVTDHGTSHRTDNGKERADDSPFVP